MVDTSKMYSQSLEKPKNETQFPKDGKNYEFAEPIPLKEIKIAVGQWLKIRRRAKMKENSTEGMVWDELNKWLMSI